MVEEPNWDMLFASIRSRYDDLKGGSSFRLQRFLNHVKNLSAWEAEKSPDPAMEAVAEATTFPQQVFVAFATCHLECGVAEFIIDGSTQECQRCGRNMFRHKVEKYMITNELNSV